MNFVLYFLLPFTFGICGIGIGVIIEKIAAKTFINDGWRFYPDELPEDKGRNIQNYPVAFFDEEFGTIVDQAEYHPNGDGIKWRSVPNGTPCMPFAWYDLPAPPWPRQTLYKAYSGNRQSNI